ncbi:MAG: ABC transporter ATP-binding protein [Acidobacteriota bacterium]|nr:MAG: ABC transporter ATP-binding protein [Acidobacteriota bacterium]
MGDLVISLDSVSKIYRQGQKETLGLDAVTLHIQEKEFVVVRGPSGSGKTTLLVLIAGLLRPSQGVITVNQQNLERLNSQQKAAFRARNVGFVFQMFHLVPYLSVLENVLLGTGQRETEKTRSVNLLESLGLGEKLSSLPAELSAGEQQRTAVARALISNPKIILADEPTGNLDPVSAQTVLDHLDQFQKGGGTVILASHSDLADRYANRLVHLKQGRISEGLSVTADEEDRKGNPAGTPQS